MAPAENNNFFFAALKFMNYFIFWLYNKLSKNRIQQHADFWLFSLNFSALRDAAINAPFYPKPSVIAQLTKNKKVISQPIFLFIPKGKKSSVIC
jgi:hypothetical protein